VLRWTFAILGAVVLAAGLLAFEPWRLFTSSEIDEPLPVSVAAPERGSRSPDGTGSTAPEPAEATEAPEVLARGTFEAAEHDTSGSASVLRLADGRRFVRLEDLASSDGPDLHVWLSDRPSGGSWGSYDDGRSVALGGLKATHGNQNYEIPADVSLAGLRSVVIWCDRFDVAFGTAPIRLEH
jgi:hypothetical protein